MTLAAAGGGFDVVIAVGASAGGVEALTDLMSRLPAGLRAPVLVVLHVAPSGTSVLAQLLGRRTALRVHRGREGEEIQAGCVYVAPPDQHLIVEDGVVRLNREPREHGHRPALDPTFRSIARAYGTHAVGVVLSGTREDGTIGLGQISAVGGHALVQDPEESLYDGMPRNAIRGVPDAEVLSLKGLAERLIVLAGEPPPGSTTARPPPPVVRPDPLGDMA